VRPGGTVAFHEPIGAPTFAIPHCTRGPPHPEVMETYCRNNVIDPYVGRKVPRLLRAAVCSTSASIR